jgi:hypothetical protein
VREGDLAAFVVLRVVLRFVDDAGRRDGGVSETAVNVGFDSLGERWLSWCTTNAAPPIPKRIGHSTRPVAPIAARVSAAAGVELLPLLTPFLIPDIVPCMPPITPFTAAPPTAPAAAVVASADRVMARVAP